MTRSVVTFLMFQNGDAEEAMQFYASTVPGAEITALVHNGPSGGGPEGTLMRGEMTICGHELRFFDSPAKHDFTFTPSISLFVECSDEAELDTVFGALSEGGHVFMPLSSYPFSTKFGWCADRFGVSWQLNLA